MVLNNPFFDSMGSILTTKKYWMETPYEEKQYNAIGVNIGLSQHLDCILHVNELNQFWQVLSPKLHYDYLFYSIRGHKRPLRKWAKKQETDDTLAEVQEYYQINKQRAKEYLKILSPEQLKTIHENLEKGTR